MSAFVAVMRRDLLLALRRKTEVDANAVKAALADGTYQTSDDGTVFDGMGGGEVLPGVRITHGDDKYTIELATTLDAPEVAA